MDDNLKKHLMVGAIPIALVVLIVIIILIIYYVKREKKSTFERYGGPPGRERAMSLADLIWVLDWESFSPDFYGTTASSMCAFMVED